MIIKSYRIFTSDLTEHYCKFARYSCSNSPTIVAKLLCNFYCLKGRTFFNSISTHLFFLQTIGFITAILQSFLSYFYCLSLKAAINGIDTSATNYTASTPFHRHTNQLHFCSGLNATLLTIIRHCHHT